MNEFKRVNIEEYVKEGLESGKLVPIQAKKTAPTHLVPGTLGEKVTSWVENEDGTPRIEREGIVERDAETGNLGWIATKVDSNGNPVIDRNGHTNQWIIKDSVFRKTYEPSKLGDNLYQKKDVQTLVQILDNIEFENKYGEVMNVAAGGYINITNMSRMYGVSERDFNDTHELAHTVSLDDGEFAVITEKDGSITVGLKHALKSTDYEILLGTLNLPAGTKINTPILLPSKPKEEGQSNQYSNGNLTISTEDGVNYVIVGNSVSNIVLSDSMKKQLEETADKSENGLIEHQVTPDMPDRPYEQMEEPMPEPTPAPKDINKNYQKAKKEFDEASLKLLNENILKEKLQDGISEDGQDYGNNMNRIKK